jgi:hypothetical protein
VSKKREEEDHLNLIIEKYRKQDPKRSHKNSYGQINSNYQKYKKSDFIVKNAQNNHKMGRSKSTFTGNPTHTLDHRRDFKKLKEKMDRIPKYMSKSKVKVKVRVNYKNKQKEKLYKKGKEKIIIKRQLKNSKSKIDFKSYSTYTSG